MWGNLNSEQLVIMTKIYPGLMETLVEVLRNKLSSEVDSSSFELSYDISDFVKKYHEQLNRLKIDPELLISGQIKQINSDGSYYLATFYETILNLYRAYDNQSDTFKNSARQAIKRYPEKADNYDRDQVLHWLADKNFIDLIPEFKGSLHDIALRDKLLTLGIENKHPELVTYVLNTGITLLDRMYYNRADLFNLALAHPCPPIIQCLLIWFIAPRHHGFDYSKDEAPILVQAITNYADASFAQYKDDLFECIKMLINQCKQKGTNLFIKVDHEGNNALMKAVLCNNSEIIDLICQDEEVTFGAFLVKNNEGKNALDEARQHNRTQVIDYYSNLRTKVLTASPDIYTALEKCPITIKIAFLEDYFAEDPLRFAQSDKSKTNLIIQIINAIVAKNKDWTTRKSCEDDIQLLSFLVNHKLMKPEYLNKPEQDAQSPLYKLSQENCEWRNKALLTILNSNHCTTQVLFHSNKEHQDLIHNLIERGNFDLLKLIFSKDFFDKELFTQRLGYYLSAMYNKNKNTAIIGNLMLEQIAINHPDQLRTLLSDATKRKNELFMSYALNHPMMSEKTMESDIILSAVVCQYDTDACLKLIFSSQHYNPALFSAHYDTGKNCLMTAAFYGNYAALKLLLERPEMSQQIFEELDAEKNNLLDYAVRGKGYEQIFLLITSSPYFNEQMLLQTNSSDTNILFTALNRGDRAAVQFILSRPQIAKILINQRDHDGLSIIHHSLFCSFDPKEERALLKMLLNSGLMNSELINAKGSYMGKQFTAMELAQNFRGDSRTGLLKIKILTQYIEKQQSAQSAHVRLSVFTSDDKRVDMAPSEDHVQANQAGPL